MAAPSDRCLYCNHTYGAHAADADPTLSWPCRGAKARFVKRAPRKIEPLKPPPFTKAPVTPSAPLIHAEPFNPPAAPPDSRPDDSIDVDFDLKDEPTTPQETKVTWSRLDSVFGYLDASNAEKLFRLCANWQRCSTEDRILLEELSARFGGKA